MHLTLRVFFATSLLLQGLPAFAGTPQLVKDINPGSGSSYPGIITPMGNSVFFVADDGATGIELWKSDGTAAGTALVRDITPGSGSSAWANDSVKAVGDTLYFMVEESVRGAELWKSTGTAAGTVMLRDINPGAAGSYPAFLTPLGNTLYFNARDAQTEALWKTDGTAAGTVKVSSTSPWHMTRMGTGLYFASGGGTDEEMWKSNGTATGTVQIAGVYPFALTVMNGTLYFNGGTPTNGRELWKSDGTASGTVLVRDINPGSGHSHPSRLTVAGNTLYFVADDGTSGEELWKSDGTAAGTVRVKDIFPGSAASSPDYLTTAGDTLFFKATDGTSGPELWKSDGTAAGTVLLKDINAGSEGSYLRELTVIGSTVYFSASQVTTGFELWKSDGTAAGTALVNDLWAGVNSSGPEFMAALGNTLYFRAATDEYGSELWSYTVETPLLAGITAVQGTEGVNLRITGEVNPAGLDTGVVVEYGTTPALGSTGAVGSFAGNSLQVFSTTLYPGGLTLSTTYYYRIVATNAAGTTQSETKTLIYAPGAPDVSFSADGVQLSSFANRAFAHDVVVQPDGKILAAGYVIAGSSSDFALARYHSDGTPDSGFGTGGTVITNFSGADVCRRVALQSDGKIVAAGYASNAGGANYDFALARYNQNGSLDTSFDTDGKVTTHFGPGANSYDAISDVAIQADGRIFAVGTSNSASVAMARYTATGSLDTTFNGTGKKTANAGRGKALAIDAAGKFVIGVEELNLDFSVLRFLPNGDADTTFGTGGRVALSPASDNEPGSVLLQTDGKIVLTGGYSVWPGTYGMAFHRFTDAGVPDLTFNGTGSLLVPLSAPITGYRAVLQRDGRIVCVGNANGGTGNGKMSIVRVNTDGTLDTTFDGDGKVVLSPGPLDDMLLGVTLDAAGNIVAAGYSNFIGVEQFAVVRVLGGPDDLLVNGSFESSERLGGWAPSGFGDWGQDQASIVAAENGITPWEGTRMAKCLGTAPTGASGAAESEIAQYVNLAPHRARISLGSVAATVTARVNRVDGSAGTDTEFGLVLAARSGTVNNGSQVARSQNTLLSDSIPATWETLTTAIALPPDTTHLLVSSYAGENVMNNNSAPEFSGHYIDAVTLSVSLPPFAPVFNADSDAGAVSASPVLTGLALDGITLNFAPPAGTNLVLVDNTGPQPITGTFSNLSQAQAVALNFGGITYNFIANYSGGTGNDLILEWNTPPVAAAQSLTILEDTTLLLALTGSDANGGTLRFSIVSPPSHGTLHGTPPSLTYTPDENYAGADALTFTVTDGVSVSDPASVSIMIRPDSDSDSLPDKWELASFGSLATGGSDDPDGDHQDNAFELLTGHAPNDGNDYLRLEPAAVSQFNVSFRLNHVRPGIRYRLENSIDLISWESTTTVTFESEGPGTIAISAPAVAGRRFYRVAVQRE